MDGALIVHAGLADADFAWADALRRAHFPPERNLIAAHLTMFHALPPPAEADLRALLAALAGEHRPPPAQIVGLQSLGRGTALKVFSPALATIRARIADHFHGVLTAQDQAGWRPHVTIQNKVAPDAAKALQAALSPFAPRPLGVTALCLVRYEGGPWRPLGRWPFRGRG